MVGKLKRLDNIFKKPKVVKGVGEIHPIRLRDYDEFLDCAHPIYYSKKHFGIEDEKISLLRIIFSYGMQDESVLLDLKKALSLVLRKEVVTAISDNFFGFVVDEEHAITERNYDEIRRVIMEQNIMYEPKIYKHPLVQKYAEKVMAERAKKGIKSTLEDMVTTVHVFAGIDYDVLADYSHYQLQASFNRIGKLKNYDTGIALQCVSTEKVKIEHFAEEINLHQNPYDDLFVGKEKISKLNKSLGN